MLAACSFEHGKLVETDVRDAAVTDTLVDAPPDAPPDGDTRCGAGYAATHGTSKYRVGVASWYDAERACEMEGAHLVVIGDAAENAFVLTLDPDGNIWIGMSDHRVEDTFRWVTGGTVSPTDTRWQSSPPQPNDAGGAEDCGEMNAGAVWNDNPCDSSQTYVCECDEVALPQTPTWCETGSFTSCDTCGDACGFLEFCQSDQTCALL